MTTKTKETEAVEIVVEKLDVAVIDEASQSTALSADLDIFADAGAGNDNVTNDDILIPRLTIAQALSPQLKKQKPEYIEGLEEGGLFNTATNEIYPQPTLIIPVFARTRFIEWVPRSSGGGLVNPDHGPEIMLETTRNEDTRADMLPNGHEVIETPEHFVIIVKDDGSWERAVVSFSKSRKKVHKSWTTAIMNRKIRNPAGQMVNPARFYDTYMLRTVMQTSDKGDFFNFKIERALETLKVPEIGRDLYLEARSFLELLKSGSFVTSTEDDVAEGGSTRRADDSKVSDAGVPF